MMNRIQTKYAGGIFWVKIATVFTAENKIIDSYINGLNSVWTDGGFVHKVLISYKLDLIQIILIFLEERTINDVMA